MKPVPAIVNFLRGPDLVFETAHPDTIRRLGGRDIPIPYNPVLERSAVPQEDDILAAARRLVLEGR